MARAPRGAMRVLIIGLGEVGRQLVEEFEQAGHEVVAIDTSAEVIELVSDYDIETKQASGTSEALLEEVDAGRCDLVVAVTNHDEVNLVAGHIAKSKGARRVVARAQGVDYSGTGEGIRTDFLWVDFTINPSVLVAQELVNFARSHGAVEVLDLVRGQIDLVQVMATDACRYLDKSISNIPLKEKETLIAGIVREGELFVPGGTDTLSENDRLYLVGKRAGLRKAEDLFSTKRESKRICIAGGGLTAEVMARELGKDSSSAVTIIEANKARATELKAALPDSVEVIFGDATDQRTLEDREVELFDLFVAVTANDEVNMMAALLAKRLGVERTAALVNRKQYVDVLRELGIDMPVSARSTASRVIVRETMLRQSLQVSTLEGGQAEVLEYFVTEKSAVAGRRLGEIGMPRGSLVTAIVRGAERAGVRDRSQNQVIIPGGGDHLEEGDRVIVLVLRGREADVAQLFGGVRA